MLPLTHRLKSRTHEGCRMVNHVVMMMCTVMVQYTCSKEWEWNSTGQGGMPTGNEIATDSVTFFFFQFFECVFLFVTKWPDQREVKGTLHKINHLANGRYREVTFHQAQKPTSQSRVGKSSTFLIFLKSQSIFLIFLKLCYFLPHFGPPGGRVANPWRPWLRHWCHLQCKWANSCSLAQANNLYFMKKHL